MKLLVATRDRRVFDVIENTGTNGGSAFDVTVALDTGAIYEAVSDVDLAIVDYADLVYHPFTREFVQTLFERAEIQECGAEAFVADPERYLSIPGRRGRTLKLPEHKVVAFTSYSGGTGKTTLAMDTAWEFVTKTRNVIELPAAVCEFTYGASALQTLLGSNELTLADLVLQPEVAPYAFHGISVFPMDYAALRSLGSDQVSRYLCQQIASNALTVIDSSWPHGMLSAAIGEEVDLWVVLTTPRVDAVENANKLRDELSEIYGTHKVILAANQMSGLGASMALWGTKRDLQFERHTLENGVYTGRLGKRVLTHLYGSLWDDYERAGRGPRGWFRRRERGKRNAAAKGRRTERKRRRGLFARRRPSGSDAERSRSRV